MLKNSQPGLDHDTAGDDVPPADRTIGHQLGVGPPAQIKGLVLPNIIIRQLYVSHFLARWGARMWEFSVGLYMINLWPNSLLLAAIYGVVESGSTAIFGPIVGHWVDRLTYLKVLRLWLVSQNLSFLVAGGTVVALLGYSDLKSTNFTVFVLLLALTNVSGAVGVLSTLAGTILIEREWVVVISEGHSPEHLTKMNSVIRRIDLTCTLFAPVVTGFIISFVSLKASALTLALWNSISVWLEYWLFVSVYNNTPALQESNRRRSSRSSTNDSAEKNPSSHHHTNNSHSLDIDNSEKSWATKITKSFSNVPCLNAWTVYLQQDVVLPGIALALLFFTVLSFGTLMTAALEWAGIQAYIIGIARGINAVFGISATLVYPILQSRISTLKTGLYSVWSQWLCLLVCVASLWVRNKVVSAYVLMIGVVLSRVGLWSFDLSVIQQMQDCIAESDRGVVGGVQNSLQSIMDLLGYAMGTLVSNPQDFWKLIVMSFGTVTFAATLYSFHVYRLRKHFFHYDRANFVGEMVHGQFNDL